MTPKFNWMNARLRTERLRVQVSPGSPFASVAPTVERRPEEAGVAGANPARGTIKRMLAGGRVVDGRRLLTVWEKSPRGFEPHPVSHVHACCNGSLPVSKTVRSGFKS